MQAALIFFAVFLLLLIVWIAINVINKNLKDSEINKITLIVSILGILVSACFSLYSLPSMFKTDNNHIEYNSEPTTEENDDSSNESYISNNDDDSIPSTSTNNQQNTSTNNSSEPIETSINTQEHTSRSIPLYETKTYLQEGSITREEIVSDPIGNTYSNAYVFWAEYSTLNTGGGHYDKPFLEKYLGGKYCNLSFGIIPYKDFDKYNKNVEAYIKIYADEKLLYTSESITRKTGCEEVNLSIENVNYLRIELNAGTDLTNYLNQYSVIIVDARLTTK